MISPDTVPPLGSAAAPAPRGFRLHWGNAIALSYVLWVLLMLGFLFSTFTEGTDALQHDRPYERGLAHEQRIAAERRAATATEPVRLVLTGQTITLSGPRGAQGRVHFIRPDDAGRDFVVPFDLSVATQLSLPLPAVRAGRWRTELHYTWQGADYLIAGEHYLQAN